MTHFASHPLLTLDVANRLIDHAFRERRRRHLKPLAIVVLDAGGHLIAFQREDGSSLFRFQIATGKATAALGMGMSTRAIRDALASRPVFQTTLAAATNGKFIPVPGGVLLLDPSQTIIGAIGVSGDTSEYDELCGIVAAHAVGLLSDPATPDPSLPESPAAPLSSKL
jgi:uncharacterized protein GlcG (DUF336 family)